jgi:hypothetical protein
VKNQKNFYPRHFIMLFGAFKGCFFELTGSTQDAFRGFIRPDFPPVDRSKGFEPGSLVSGESSGVFFLICSTIPRGR